MLIAASVACVALTLLPARAAELQPGLWEIRGTVESGGTSTVRPTRTRCMTAEQLGDFQQMPSRHVTVGEATCKSADLHKTDNGMTWTMQCPPLPFRMAASYAADTPQHYVFTVRREMIIRDFVFASSTVTLEGRRIGECPK